MIPMWTGHDSLLLQWPKVVIYVMEELFSLLDITWPLVLTGLLIFARSPLSMFFLGRLGDVELAGGSLAMGFANITGYSVMKGLSMGMEPVCVQAFGAKKWNLISQAFQKTLLILLLACIPIAIFWLNMKTILLRLGQDQHITAVASVYLVFCLPDLLAHALLHPLRIFLRSQGRTKPLTMSATISFLFHIPINYLLVVYLKLGMKGVALSSAWTTINTNLVLVLYLYLYDAPVKPWAKTNIEQQNRVMLQNRTLLTMSFTSAVFVCLEWWWYEVMVILCGRLSDPKATVAAMGILIQTTGLIYAVPSSLSSGVSARVGHELGAGRPARAQWAAAVGLAVAAACGLAALVLTTIAKNLWGRIFTSDREILSLVSTALPIVGLCELGNCPQTVGCGVLTGSARPKAAASINFIAFYLIGLPVSILLAFVINLGFPGLWFGLLAAQVSCMIMMLHTVKRTDWEFEVDKALQLTKSLEDADEDEFDKLETGFPA